MSKKLTISIDMGAKNNGIFIVKSDGKAIESKKASCIVVDNISFSKQNRTQNRHRIRNSTRFDLARRLLKEFIDFDLYKQPNKQRQFYQEQIVGLLHNRGFDRVEGAFEELDTLTIEFLQEKIPNIKELSTASTIDIFVNNSESSIKLEKELKFYKESISQLFTNLRAYRVKEFIRKDIEKIVTNKFSKFSSNTEEHIRKILIENRVEFNHERGKLKNQLVKNEIDVSAIDFEKELNKILKVEDEFLDGFSILEHDLKMISDKENDPSISRLFETLIEAIATGAKPRKMYQSEIRKEIEKFSFIASEDKADMYHIVANISNLQLRVLRKYFNGKMLEDNKLDEKKLSKLLYKYFVSRHYTKDFEKERRKELFDVLKEFLNPKKKLYEAKKFFLTCSPEHTIPPYEDMNNRDTYKCNSLLINAKRLTDGLKRSVDILLNQSQFDMLVNSSLIDDKDYSQMLQRILDINSKNIDKSIHPRNVFKHQRDGTNIQYYQDLLKDDFKEFSDFSKEFYSKEESAINGIFDEEDKEYIFLKCAKNTPAKRNIKHELINAIFASNFQMAEDIEIFKQVIEKKKIKTKLEKISNVSKKYQNEFFKNLLYANELKNTKDKKVEYANLNKDIKDILAMVDDLLGVFKIIFSELNQKSYLDNNFLFEENEIKIKKRDKNLKRFVNSIKQTYDVLYLDTGGHNKTCKSCTKENNERSNEEYPLAKRLLSDVAKPINGKLDMLLARIAWETIQPLDEKYLNDVENIEILLEQNKFSFEKSLHELKIRKKEPEEQELAYNICPYTGKKFDKKNGEYDHILSQSSSQKEKIQVYNSEANLILCSSEGNKEKDNKVYTFNELKTAHLKIIFGTEDKEVIKQEIIAVWDNPKSGLNYYTSFRNLKFNEQRAFRYALFFNSNDSYFKKAEALLRQEQRTITNGTQKRLAKLIFSKLPKSYSNAVNVKVIDNKEVSSTRKELAEYYRKFDKNTGEVLEDKNLTKQDKQSSYSHIVDAMVVYYVANKLELDDFKLIEMNEQLDYTQMVKTQHWYETNNKNYKINSKRLFDEKDIGVGYVHLQELISTDSKGKEKTTFKKGMVKDSFVSTTFNLKDFQYFMSKNILEKMENQNYCVNKSRLYEVMFDEKDEVLKNISHYTKLTKELRYTYTKFNPFDILAKFLEPLTADDKKAVFNIIKKKNPLEEDITVQNIMAWFSRGSKLEKSGAKLGYYKSWEIFTKVLVENKEELFSVVETKKYDKKSKEETIVKSIKLDKETALDYLTIPSKKYKHPLFKVTHTKRRDKKKNGYTLYSASKADTQYVHRRKANGKYIYQTRIANGHNKLKGFIKGFSDEKYFFEGSSNIIPLTMKNYREAFASKL